MSNVPAANGDASDEFLSPGKPVELLPDGPLEGALAELRRDWRDGKRVPVAEGLREKTAITVNAAWAAELIYAEFILRRESGESPSWDAYLEQFPQYAPQLRAIRLADLIVDQTMLPAAGAIQLGDYQLIEEIGRGGMGVVYRAIQNPLGRLVAVKVLGSGVFADAAEIERLKSEMVAASRLSHPNIVHVYGVGEASDQPYIVFELIDGPSLQQRIDGTPLAGEMAARFLAAVAQAVDYANQEGVIHRDLKPANVLLTGSGDQVIAKVTDFGASKEIRSGISQPVSQIIGTPSYMAPEQVDERVGRIGKRTDVYGIGTILYECLTGMAPFRGKNAAEILRQVIDDAPVAPRLLNRGAPRDLEIICLKCLQKNPNDRYASAKDVADELNRFLAGEPIKARQPGLIRVVRLWRRRNPAVANLAVALAVVLLCGLVGIGYQWRRIEAARERAEIARSEAIANGEVAQEVVHDLIDASARISILGDQSDQLRMEPLVRAARRCQFLLDKDPDNVGLRTTLTDVCGRLGSLCYRRGQVREMSQWLSIAQTLWESRAPNDLESRKNVAKINAWLGGAAALQADFALKVKHFKRATELWLDLIDEKPLDLTFLSEFARCRRVLISTARLRLGRKTSIDYLKAEKRQLAGLVRETPADLAARKKLAFTCVLLGVAEETGGDLSVATALWKEAYEQYRVVILAAPDDFLSKGALGECCLRLSTKDTSNPYYREGVLQLNEALRQLTGRIRDNPEGECLKRMMVQNCCILISCHLKVGDAARGRSIYERQLQPVMSQLTQQYVGPDEQLLLAVVLYDLASQCRDSGMRDAGLAFARQAAAINSSLATDGKKDLIDALERAQSSLSIAIVLNQMDDNVLALQQAELSRQILERCEIAAPDALMAIRRRLASTWERIGKIHWKMNQFDAALGAFREAVAVEKRAFEDAKADSSARSLLDHRYVRLGYWSGLRRDWAGVVATLTEREKLWPTSSEELTAIAMDYATLADKVSVAGPTAPLEAQKQRTRFVAEAARLRHAAENARRRANGESLSRNSGS
jgi:tetratricopeptide (TPR) repeat protein